MSLRKSLKKLADNFSADFFQNLVINSFREIMLIILGFFLIIILLIVLFLGARSCVIKNSASNQKKTTIQKERQKVEDKKQFDYASDVLVTNDDFMMPKIDNFDIRFDYLEFNPNKYYNLPKINIFEKEYNQLFNDYMNDSLKFDFEKRKIKRD